MAFPFLESATLSHSDAAISKERTRFASSVDAEDSPVVFAISKTCATFANCKDSHKTTLKNLLLLLLLPIRLPFGTEIQSESKTLLNAFVFAASFSFTSQLHTISGVITEESSEHIHISIAPFSLATKNIL